MNKLSEIFPFEIFIGAVAMVGTTCREPAETNKVLPTDIDNVFVLVFIFKGFVVCSVLFNTLFVVLNWILLICKDTFPCETCIGDVPVGL